MIIKVWFEPTGLRARLTGSFDVVNEAPVVTAASSVAGILANVAEWLTHWTTSQRTANGPGDQHG